MRLRFIKYRTVFEILLQALLIGFLVYIINAALVNYQANTTPMGVSFGWSFLDDASGFPVHQSLLEHILMF